MADSKLKLSIVTALDNAGIKATEQQINGLMKSIQDGNRKIGSGLKGSMEGVDGSVNGMFKGVKTFMKDIAIAVGLTKAVGTAAMKVFEDVETKGKTASESIQSTMRSAVDSASEFLFGTSIGAQYNRVVEEAQKAAAAQIAGIEAINTSLDKQQKKIDDVSQRYIKQRQSVNALKKSVDEADDIMYDREQLWMVEQIRATEGDEAARQAQEALQVIGATQKYHRQIAAFDDETVKYTENLEATKQKIEALNRAKIKANAQLEAAKKLQAGVEEEIQAMRNVDSRELTTAGQIQKVITGGYTADFLNEAIDKNIEGETSKGFLHGLVSVMSPVNTALKWLSTWGDDDREEEIRSARGSGVSAANKVIRDLAEQEQKLLEQQQLEENALQKREMDRANLVSRYQHEIDKMEFAREQARDNDSQVFYDINQESIDRLYDFSVETAKYQKETADNTQDLADKLDMLLQMKQ